ncbi:lactate dehydrogenase-like 2-hydroxyacid dehydrogenase [Primorskyibacter sedentarius]|uniref:Lactate dehydrogenase-like 2-hydroxyacid dehydrogenase n=1 Tax=Primorskyibacter sedentarius TaxID=745311 RepID=A0A4R3JI45_9RHOB|nr:2-hydroxyacid dehydrogenase [Primorskyibacter sedentarius]TCS65868.1 lactate dehydrogenase-like 2-hydroxyacid dehydrogenase [Primorskyibacter sedentarius]
MSDPVLLISGAAFTDEERARLEASMPFAFVSGPPDMAALEEGTRKSIRAIAFKGHHALTGAEMDLFPSLGVIANYGVGYDAIDIAAATARGIKVTNTPDVLNDDVADLAVAMLIAQCRNMVAGDALVRSGRWSAGESFPLNRQMSGSTVGIVGLGRIGREIANRLAAFKCEIHYTSRSEKETPGWTYHSSPVEMAKAVDVLVVALVGGKETEGHVSRQVIDALGPRGIVINISRGSTIDEGALLDALEEGRIAGAGLDVFLNEPKVDPRFLKLDNVHLQPHQGSGSVETRRRMAKLQLANIEAFLAGEPLQTPVN